MIIVWFMFLCGFLILLLLFVIVVKFLNVNMVSVMVFRKLIIEVLVVWIKVLIIFFWVVYIFLDVNIVNFKVLVIFIINEIDWIVLLFIMFMKKVKINIVIFNVGIN